MFALMCLTVPLALIPYDAEGLPMPIGVTARYGSVRHLMPSGEHPLRFLPGEKNGDERECECVVRVESGNGSAHS